ncbi:MAG: hypothetical protein KF768_12115 [Phycisphaeraceae bacterium]|nr:hypothetical protein [Phycisphaeraceae bacterium]
MNERNRATSTEMERELSALRDLCVELDALSLEQHGLVGSEEAGAVESLPGVMERRQMVIERMEAVRARIGDASGAGGWGEVDGSERERARCGALLAEIAAIVEGVRTRDGGDRAELVKKRDEVTRELVALSRGRGAIGAYADAQRGNAEHGTERGAG